MKAVVRIALGYFQMLPLQRWLTLLGAVLVAAGMVLTLTAADPKTSIAMTAFPGLAGALMIGIVPFAFGGMALRYGSSRAVIHLRPHGRVCMMLAATLAITLVATAVSLPILAEYHFFTAHGFRTSPAMQPAGWFLGTWMATAVTWLIMFISSSSRLLMSLTAPAICAAAIVLRYAAESIAPDVLGSFEPDIRILAVAVFSAWVAFAVWYCRTSAVGNMAWLRDFSRLGTFTLGRQKRAPISGVDSPSHALRQYLLGDTPAFILVSRSIFPILILFATRMVLPETSRTSFDPAFFLFILAIGPGVVGFLLVRRARCLWLRMGSDRLGLFRLVEQLGLPTALVIFGIGAIIVLAILIPGRREQAPVLFSYAATVAALAIFLFYFGCSLTRSWDRTEAILSFSVLAMFVAVFAAINPLRQPAIATIWAVTVLLVLLTLLLRWHATRRWRALDWRIVPLPRTMRWQTI
jgi:hypothetical protein